MNKKYIIAALGLSLSVGLFSCEKQLDELKPEQDLTGEAAFATEATTMSTLYGVYSTLQNYEIYGGLTQVIGDFQADNVEFVGSFPTLQEIANYNVVGSNSSIQTLWQVYYRAILRANKVIAKTPAVTDPGFTEEEKVQVVAEAKFLRALLYLNLSNLFSQPYQVSDGTNLSVPLVLESFEGEIDFPERATLNEVHAQIEQDLMEAIPNLNTAAEFGDPSEMRGRATVGAAQALLARLYLYRENWAQAEEYARKVLEAPSYELAGDYGFYNANSSEDVFTIQNSAIDNGRTGSGGLASYYRPASDGGRGDAPFSDDLIAAYQEEPGDLRFTSLSSEGVAADAETHLFTLKYPDAANNSDNSPVIRVTEVVLTLAEAIAQQEGVTQEAIDLMNQLRARAGLPLWTTATFSSKEAFIDAILNERRKELAFEGFRRMDLLRYEKPLRTSGEGADKAVFGGNYTILPIPQRELDINPSLEPNPGY
ncbi:RagB/SusD family nutrient uptake outer membrane protein [Pontibacter sp. 172403-2]|uniref:RagB/SusD family nutrient uptake outer membrane protein n=1 Tax=Pontibacter rufus TaxID=2791028 RepID=UPI0018AF8550|nr:RagB/SusD family nutrient uptake outer membrane protein [Pontibacter sp. 172403-2]MBF9251831.1 RagB/SusD family nutrient uptake outer membrane protein [Pontibacter sp. 172403-2]